MHYHRRSCSRYTRMPMLGCHVPLGRADPVGACCSVVEQIGALGGRIALGKPLEGVEQHVVRERYLVDREVAFEHAPLGAELLDAIAHHRDLVFVHCAMGAILDPTSDPVDNTLTKVGVDATKPDGADFAERLTIADQQRARVRSLLLGSGIRI